MSKIPLIFTTILLFLACANEEGPTAIDVVDLIPTNNEISGWVRDGNMDVAENETQLYDLIDGDGEVYLDYGFVKCAFQNFQGQVLGNPRDVEVRAFDMGNSTNAQEVYDDIRLVSDEVPWIEVGHAGTEARIESSSGYHMIEFWEERFYVDILIIDQTQEALNVAKLFAINVSDAIH